MVKLKGLVFVFLAVLVIINFASNISALCPDANTDGNVNVIDLAIVIFNQGHNPVTEPNYAHLDFDESGGMINWDDVNRVIGRMGGSC